MTRPPVNGFSTSTNYPIDPVIALLEQIERNTRRDDDDSLVVLANTRMDQIQRLIDALKVVGEYDDDDIQAIMEGRA